MSETDVLIVGAGPTGLVLALWLSKLNIKVRIIEKAARAATSTRAIVVHARTVELYDQLDPSLAQELCEKAHPIGAVNMWVRGRRAFQLSIADLGRDLTPRARMQTISQHEHERMLADRLLRCYGVAVELEMELLDFSQQEIDAGVGAEEQEKEGAGAETKTVVTALVQTKNQTTQIIRAKYLAGCDGSHSLVRKTLGIAFPGETYERLFYVADICGEGPVMDGQVHTCLDKSDFLAVFPLAGRDGHGRLLGTMEEPKQQRQHEQGAEGAEHQDPRQLTFEDVGDDALRRVALQVNKVNWFSSYRLHHRVASRFRHGRAFLLGDAAHVHSPVGGQGMNTGIGDAVNLAWKMAAVVQGTAPTRLLETYEEERRSFAETLVASTDRAFTMVTSEGWVARCIRTRVMPLVWPVLFSSRAFRRHFFATMSQLRLHYRHMALSSSSSSSSSPWSSPWSSFSRKWKSLLHGGCVQAGERLPWVKMTGRAGVDDNFASLDLRWQIHVYGAADGPLPSWCEEHHVPLVVYPFGDGCAAAGLVRDALYLVRPDGHVALVVEEAAGSAAVEAVERYFDERGMRVWS